MATSTLMAAGNVAFAFDARAARPIRKIRLDRMAKPESRLSEPSGKARPMVQGWARAFLREGL
jgi:hypothetical protein